MGVVIVNGGLRPSGNPLGHCFYRNSWNFCGIDRDISPYGFKFLVLGEFFA